MQRAQMINMSCGQTDIYPESLEAMGRQLGTPIYYPPYWEIEVKAIDLLRKMINTANDILLVVGTATYGEEACMLSALEPGDKVLTVNTGVFGRMLTDIAGIVGAQSIEIQKGEGESVDPTEIRAKLEEDKDIKMVAVVHVETSMGTINPVDRIGEVLRDYPDVLYMVDGVSSLASTEIRVDDWGIDFLATSTQKCLCAPQGLAIVAVSEKGWQATRNRSTPINSLCLDLTVWKRCHDAVRIMHEKGSGLDVSFAGGAKASHTPSPSYVLVKALGASLEAIFEEGLENVYRRHRVASRAVREAVQAMGLKVMAKSEKNAAPVATRILFPEDMDRRELTQRMAEHNVAIGGLRIGSMGFVASPKYVLPTINALEQVLLSMGYDFEEGWGVEAARRVFAKGM